MSTNIIEKIDTPKGLLNSIFPWTKQNKNFRKLQELEISKNQTHIQKMQTRIQKVLKYISHSIGYLTTGLFTASPWLFPIMDIKLGLAHSINNHISLTWWDHVGLTVLPGLTHLGLWASSKISKIAKGIITIIPVIFASPYIIYKYFTKKAGNEGIRYHKKECTLCSTHSNKVKINKIEEIDI